MSRHQAVVCSMIVIAVPSSGASAQDACLPAPLLSGNVVLRMPQRPEQPAIQLSMESTVVHDFDQDGSLDLIHGTDFGSLVYFRGRADWWDFDPPVITNLPFVQPPAGMRWKISALTTADLDADGNWDLAIGDEPINFTPGTTQRIHIMLGNGDGTFQPASAWGPVATHVGKFKVADFDGDNDRDLICTGNGMPVTILWNTGDGTFPNFNQVAPNQDASGLDVADIENDGDMDAVVGFGGAFPSVVLRNNGDGNFVTEPLNPSGGFGHAFGDLNGDARPDLVRARGGCSSSGVPQTVDVLLNDGTGHYRSSVQYLASINPSEICISSDPLVADLDGDGRDEVIVGRANDSCNATDSHDQILVFANTGDGTLEGPLAIHHFRASFGQPLFLDADLNQDGRSEVIAISRASTTLLLNDGTGSFRTEHGSPMGPLVPAAVCSSGSIADFIFNTLGDVNNDGRLDIIAVRENTSPPGFLECTVMLQDAQGAFTTVLSTPMPERSTTGLALADFDRDGNLDLAVTTQTSVPPDFTGGQSVRVALGNGNGTFDSWVTYQTVGHMPRSLAAGDLNGDLYPDLVVPTRWGPNYPASTEPKGVSVFLNNQDGTMDPPIQYNTGEDNLDVAIADLNGDGYPDIGVAFHRYVTVPSVNGAKVLLNNGNGTFSLGQTFILRPEIDEAAVAWRIAFADVNSDDRPDMFVTCNYVSWEPTSGGISVAINNGNGTFQRGMDLDLGTDFRKPVFADFDGDGDVDLARYNGGEGIHAGSTIGISLGNGDGTFGPRIEYGGSARGLFVHDFNNDGRPDLASPMGCSPDSDTNTHVGFSILLNRLCPAPAPCPADIAPSPSGDGSIGVPDLLMIINSWGPCGNPKSCPADISPDPNGDGTVGVPDLLFIINNWGPCPR